MTDTQNITTKNKKIVIKPMQSMHLGKQIPLFVTTKTGVSLLKGDNSAKVFVKRSVAAEQARNLIKEDVIYESNSGDFFKGNPHEKLTIVNRLNLITNSCRTIAKYTNTITEQLIRECTSDNVVRLIGQKNYDIVFSALCSVISQELKIRGMLALLTLQKKYSEFMGQTDDGKPVGEEKTYTFKKNLEEKCCQTDENCMDILFKAKQRKRIKRTQLTPYVVKDNPELKKVVIHPHGLPKTTLIMDKVNDVKYELLEQEDMRPEQDPLPDLKPDLNHYLNEDSNDGSISSIGNLSIGSSNSNLEELLKNPSALLEKVDQFTNQSSATREILNPAYITMPDGSQIMVTVKPEDHFHIATPEILKNVTNEERVKLLLYQAFIDWKTCLHRDEDGNLPIHVAVLNNDLDFLRRQCLVLRNRQSTLDLVANDVTPLQMSLFLDKPQCTSMLLQYGADPLATDSNERSILHLACESSPDHLRAVILYCQNNARDILQDNDELWRPALEGKTNEQLAEYLLDYMSKTIDNQGYTPLMVASKLGAHACVKLLTDASPRTVNTAMPNCGNTALYLAVGSACIDAENRGNRSKVAENYKLTIQTLMSSGADPGIPNHSNQTVNDLLTEFNFAELSMLVANTITSIKFGMPEGSRSFDSYMLVKEEDGKVNIKDLEKSKDYRKVTDKSKDKQKVTKSANSKAKPIILKSITLPKTATVESKVEPVKPLANSKEVSSNDKMEKPVEKAILVRGIEDAKIVTDLNFNSATTSSNINKAVVQESGANNVTFINKYSNFVIEYTQREYDTVSALTQFAKTNTIHDVDVTGCPMNAKSENSIPGNSIEMASFKITPHGGNLVIDANARNDMTDVIRDVKVDSSDDVTVIDAISSGNAGKRKLAAVKKPNRSKKQKGEC